MSASKTALPRSTEIPIGPLHAPALAPETIQFTGRTKHTTTDEECFWEDVSLSFTPISSSSPSASGLGTVGVNGFCTLITDSAPVPCMIMGDYHSAHGLGTFAVVPIALDADFAAAKSPCSPAPQLERFEFALRVAPNSSKRAGGLRLLFFSNERRGVLRTAAGVVQSHAPIHA